MRSGKKQYKYKKTLFVLIIASISAMLLYAALFFVIMEKGTNVASSLNALELALQKERQSREIKEVLRETEEERTQLDRFLVKSDMIVNFIERVEILGEHAEVSLAFSSVNVDEETDTLLANIRTDGNFLDTFYFLSLLEAMPLRISLEEVTLQKPKESRGGAGGTSGEWEGRYTLRLLGLINESQ